MTQVTMDDMLMIVGSKEVELQIATVRLNKAAEVAKLQQAKITELEQKLHDLTADNASDAKGVPDAV